MHLADQVHGDLVAAELFGVPLLPAEALHIRNRQAKDLDLVKRRLDGFELAGLDDGDDELMRGKVEGVRRKKLEEKLHPFGFSSDHNARGVSIVAEVVRTSDVRGSLTAL